MKVKTMLNVLLLTTAVTACKGDDTPPNVDDARAATEDIGDFLCGCLVDSVYSTAEECRESLGLYLPDAYWDCIGSTAANSSTAEDALACEIPAVEAYRDCIVSQTCTEAVDGMNATFTCGDGDVIPGTWKCDGEADCEDGSDEQNCDSLPATCDSTFNEALLECPSQSIEDQVYFTTCLENAGLY